MLKDYPLRLNVWRFGTTRHDIDFMQKYKIIHNNAPYALLPYFMSAYHPREYYQSDFTCNSIFKICSDHLIINYYLNNKSNLLRGLNSLSRLFKQTI